MRIFGIVQAPNSSQLLSGEAAEAREQLDTEIAQNEAIQVMQISQKRMSLYVSTDHRIKQIDLAMCNRRYDSCFRCVKDPYCGWDSGTNACRTYDWGLLQVNG